tara:strand:- start:328 stop:561 length:234 start_codon:yes stop_codon:yes gene_type:complete
MDGIRRVNRPHDETEKRSGHPDEKMQTRTHTQHTKLQCVPLQKTDMHGKKETARILGRNNSKNLRIMHAKKEEKEER